MRLKNRRERGDVRLEEKSARKVASGALLLVSANFFVKLIGFVYKIPIGNILGNAALGYFSTAFEIYTLLLTIFISGGSIAVSKMISDSAALGRWANVRRTFRVLLVQFSIVGAAGTAVMYFGAGTWADFLGNSKATLSIVALSPAIFFLAVSCIFRGFFQGLGDMRQSSLSEVVEALFKLIIGVCLTLWLRSLGKGDDVVSAGAIAGSSLSVLVSALVVIAAYLLSSHRRRVAALSAGDRPDRIFPIVGRFWRLAIPIALSSVVVNLTSFLDLFLIFDRLVSTGMTEDAANRVYGAYKGYAQSLFNLAPSIISSINVSILPALSAHFVTGRRREAKRLVERSLKVVNLLALPSAVGLLVLAGPISRLLYPYRLDEIVVAIPILKILAVASYWTCLSTLATSLLQASGKTHLPLISLICGGAVKLGVNYILVGIPAVGINGAPIGTLACYLVMTAMNTVFLSRMMGTVNGRRVRLFRWCVRPAFASAVMGAAAYFSQRWLALVLRERWATILAILLAVVIYALTLLLVRGVRKRDLELIPGGRRLAALLMKTKLLGE